MTSPGGRGSSSSAAGSTAHGDTRSKANFNVLLEELGDETESVSEASEKVVKDQQEESLEQLLAPAVVSPTSSMADESEWATATSSKQHKGKKQPPVPLMRQTTTNPPGIRNQVAAVQPPPIQAQHHQTHQHSHSNTPNRPPKEPVNLSEETTLEFYDFPSAFRTSDLKASLQSNEDGPRYRIKWNNDTSCWFVFENSLERDRASKLVEDYINAAPAESQFKVRIYSPSHYPRPPI